MADDDSKMKKQTSLFRRRAAAIVGGDRTSTPSTPRLRSSAETENESTPVSSPIGSASFMHLEEEDEQPRKKKSFFGLKSRISKHALFSSTKDDNDQQFIISQPQSPRLVENRRSPTSASASLHCPPIRNRKSNAPHTPSRRGLPTSASSSSLMSTDSINTIATVSPHGRSGLRHVSTPETHNPPIDPDFSFEKFLESRNPNSTERVDSAETLSSRGQNTASTSSTPYKPPKRKDLVAMFGEAEADRFQGSFSGMQSPGLPSADLADTDPEEWAKAVEVVRKMVQKEKAIEEQQKEAPPEDRHSVEFGEFERRCNARLSLRIEREEGYAAKLIDWCERNGFDFCSDLPIDIERKELWEAIKRWEEKNSESDPGMERIRRRFFSKLGLSSRKKSTPQLQSTPRLPLTPCLSSTSLRSKFLAAANNIQQQPEPVRTVSSDRPVESSPDEEHYGPIGLGIITEGSSPSEVRVQTPEQYEGFHDSSTNSISPPGANDPWNTKHPISLGNSSYGTPRAEEDLVTSPTANSILKQPYASSIPDSEWESINSDNVSHPGPGSISTSLSDDDHSAELQGFTEDSPGVQTPSSYHAKAARFSTLSTLNVRRDSTRARLTPKRNDSFHEGRWQQQIEEAKARRVDKLGMSESPLIGHPALRESPVVSRPALRLDTDVSSPKLTALPPLPQDFDLPTPTRKASAPLSGETSLLRKLQLSRSPNLLASKIPRPAPPKYGQRISPGKSLDDGISPIQASGTTNLNKATPLPQPARPGRSFTEPLPGKVKAAVEEYDSPVDRQFDDALNTWQAVTPQIPLESPATPSFPTASERKYVHDIKLQKLRKQLGLPLLELRPESDLPHPHHEYAWDTMNIMCRGIHRRNHSATSSDNTSPTASIDDPEDSPLDRFSKRPHPIITPSTSRRISSNGILLSTRGKSCFQCGSTCCYYQEQQKLSQLSSSRDRMAQKLAETARQRCEVIAKKYPAGIEEYDAHMACSECSRVFCFEHGSLCKDLLCRHALCADCDRQVRGRCVEHRE